MLRRARPLLVALAALAPLAVSGVGAFAASAPSDTPTNASTVPPDDDPSTPDALNEAAEKSKTAPYRMEVFVDFSGMGMTPDPDMPFATGEFAAGRGHIVMDLGAVFGDMLEGDDVPPELGDADLTMEYVIDGTDMYLRAPFFAALAEQSGGASGPLAAFIELGDGWGYIDTTAIQGMAPGDIAGSMGVAGADPSAFFEVLSNVTGAERIGTEEIRGVSTTGVRAEVSLLELMEAQGIDPAQMEVAGMEDLANLTVPIEVWIDKDGFVRRFLMELDAAAIADAAETAGEDVESSTLAGFEMSMTIEVFDYGAEDIVIEAPTEFVDITEAFADLMATPTTQGLR